MVMYSLIKNKGEKNAMKMEEIKAVEVVKWDSLNSVAVPY